MRQLQRSLHRLGYEPGPIDGAYGPLTAAAVELFQLSEGLVADGVVGPRTRAALAAALRPWAGRSAQVAALQRRLRRLGHDPGPVDGLYGPLTRAAVERFQRAQDLVVDGVVGPQTSAAVRAAIRGKRRARPDRKRATAPAPRLRGSPERAAARPPPAGGVRPTPDGARASGNALRPAGESDGGSSPPARAAPQPGGGSRPDRGGVSRLLLVLIGGSAATALTLLSIKRGARPRVEIPAGSNGHGSAPAIGGSQRVVGYASGLDPGDLDRQADAIERACRERGWTLVRVVRDEGSGEPKALNRPGLAHALRQLREGSAARLVVDRLAEVGHSTGELKVLLQWCASHDVDLVALDVGLDTSTHEGRLAAGCLLAVGNGRPARPSSASTCSTPAEESGNGARGGTVES